MQPANDAAQRLNRLHDELAQAADAADWAAVAVADEAVRRCLASLGNAALLDERSRSAWQRLHALHTRVMRACAKECERLRQKLDHHLEYAEGRSAYQQIGLIGQR
ncbi:hypothetical protein [Pseudomonas sp. Marseille-QA0892]